MFDDEMHTLLYPEHTAFKNHDIDEESNRNDYDGGNFNPKNIWNRLQPPDLLIHKRPNLHNTYHGNN